LEKRSVKYWREQGCPHRTQCSRLPRAKWATAVAELRYYHLALISLKFHLFVITNSQLQIYLYIYTSNGKPSPESLTQIISRTYHPVLLLTYLSRFQYHLLSPILSVSNLKSTNISKMLILVTYSEIKEDR